MIMFNAKDMQLKQWTVTDPQGYDTTVAVYNLDTTRRRRSRRCSRSTTRGTGMLEVRHAREACGLDQPVALRLERFADAGTSWPTCIAARV